MIRPPHIVKKKVKGAFKSKKDILAKRLVTEVQEMEKAAVSNAVTLLEEASKVDGKLSHVWKLWEIRANRILSPNYVSHMKSIIFMTLHILQMLMILKMTHETNGHIGNVRDFGIVMLPIYTGIGFTLALYVASFAFTVHNALYVEKHQDVLRGFDELHRLVPVMEQLLPIITYCLVFVTALSVGMCHLNFSSSQVDSQFCATFNLGTVKVVIGLYMTVQIIHHLLAIFNHCRHASLPRRKYHMKFGDRAYQLQENEEDDVLGDLCSLDEDITAIWEWWKMRMNRILSAHVTQNICNLLDIVLEGVTLVLLIQAVHNCSGNLGNINNMPELLIPIYVKFFGKALAQVFVIMYVGCNHFPAENRLYFLQFFHEPRQVLKTVEHCIPVVTNIFFGLIAMAIGQCHLNTSLGSGHTMCSIFSYNLVYYTIIVVGLAQIFHHGFCMYQYHTHMAKPVSRKDSQRERVELKSMSSVVH